MMLTKSLSLLLACITSSLPAWNAIHAADAQPESQSASKPNIVFLLTDDHRWDCLSAAGNAKIRTPNLDRICASGTRFKNAFVTLAICSPSRAACLTGRYGSSNGVTEIGKRTLAEGETTFAQALAKHGYATGVTGKWHLGSSPEECGFEYSSVCWSNGTWYGRSFTTNGETAVMPGFVDDVAVDQALKFISQSVESKKPFALWLCTQVPHMDHRHSWPAKPDILGQYAADEMVLPKSWSDDLSDKPEYLKTSRYRTRGLEYGYDNPAKIQEHKRAYYASVQQMDEAVGRLFDELEARQLMGNTWIIFMGDNGWMLGEHGMTSKVLPYEESMRVPMAIMGPGAKNQVRDELVLNIDLTATIYKLGGIEIPKKLHGRSLLPIVHSKERSSDWRKSFLYEAPTSQLGSKPLWALRNARWKYIETKTDGGVFSELYDLEQDAAELDNLAEHTEHRSRVAELSEDLQAQLVAFQPTVSTQDAEKQSTVQKATTPKIPAEPPPTPRTDIFISGVYPHLTTYGVYSQNGAHHKGGHNECGIGAVVPWAGKLWMVNYAPHMPRGSEHKLYSVDADLSRPMTVHPESVGGTPAGRMIHAESKQLLIGHHLVDERGEVRTISPADMPIRVTAIARHLRDPKNMVYYIDMEGSVWEANVHSLAVKRLFKKPVPGWHGKGGYTSQGRLVLSNNGELHVGTYKDVLVGGEAKNEEERGVLAEFDGESWKIVERRQFTEVTGPKGIVGGSDGDDPIWSMGWDRRSVRLKVMDDGEWHTFLLPKAAYCNDASHGWYTEWPRIREITGGRWMMDMHGMFYDFPKTFSAKNSAGIRPIGSHLRYVPDFCDWNGKLVLASDETSIQGNPLAGQPQSNLWFGKYEDLKEWGPATGYGGPWVEDKVQADVPSDPFLVAGFDRRVVHLAVGRKRQESASVPRTADKQSFDHLPEILRSAPSVSVYRGDWHKPASGFAFTVDQPVTVYLSVDSRGKPELDGAWKLTELSTRWENKFVDRVYVREFPAGDVTIPANETEHSPKAFGMPHTAFVVAQSAKPVDIQSSFSVLVTRPEPIARAASSESVTFKIQVDTSGTGVWSDLQTAQVPAGGNTIYYLPEDLDAQWIRFITDRDCIATAFLHQTAGRFADGSLPENRKLFSGLADVSDATAFEVQVYAAKRNRNLRLIAGAGEFYEFTKAMFDFKADKPDEALRDLLHVEPEFTVDKASVVVSVAGKRFRLPKGDSAYDRPFTSGWPRVSREVESERHLANIHGTFYEIPLITNGAPPAWHQMRPVSSHSKRIADFCTWNGLLVLTGVQKNAAATDEHVFQHPDGKTALWFGGIDDLWKLGKPVGRGGPWLDEEVAAGEVSDPYLMAGYDRKTVEIQHLSKQSVKITLEVEIDGSGLWLPYQTFTVPAGAKMLHAFPAAFSARWIRARCHQPTTVSVQLQYR